MKVFLIIIGVVAMLGITVFFLWTAHRRALLRTQRYNCYITLRDVANHYRISKELTNPVPRMAVVFRYETNVLLSGEMLRLQVGILWTNLTHDPFFMAAAEDGRIVVFDRRGRPASSEFASEK